MARHVARVMAAFCVAVAGLLLAPGTAYACSCVAADPEHLARSAGVVLVGTVEHRDGPPWWQPVRSSGDPVTYRVAVDGVYKGNVGPVALVDSARSGASCGIEVALGEEYVVYADRQPSGDLTADLCGGTTAADATALAMAERTLGPSTPPDPSIAVPSPRSSLLWPAAGVVLAAGAVASAAAGVRALRRG